MNPGYFCFVQGECTPETYATHIPDEIKQLYSRVLYSHLNELREFYRVGIVRSYRQLQAALPIGTKLTNLLKRGFLYFYNRQLIVQLSLPPKRFHLLAPEKVEIEQTLIPHEQRGNVTVIRAPRKKQLLLSSKPISIPLYRAPGEEIQVDTLRLTPAEIRENGGYPYLVVATDPFSRYVWASNVKTLESKRVLKALQYAFSRPGEPEQFYNHVRDTVQRLVVDGGSEFKDTFAEHYRVLFPHAKLIVSDPKRTTHGRPTGTGPVEAAIRSLRRVLRDQEVGVHPSFLLNQQEGFSRALISYNHQEQINHQIPTNVMKSFTQGSQGVAQLYQSMEQLRQDRIQLAQQQQVLFGGKYSDPRQYGYRLYLPPQPFQKEVQLRVSIEVYRITSHVNSTKVNLVEIDGDKEVKNVLWSQLVLIKLPIDNGPPQIKRNFLHLRDNTQFVPVRRDDGMQPFAVTPAILQAITGGVHPQVPAGPPQMDPNQVPGVIPPAIPYVAVGNQVHRPAPRNYWDPVLDAEVAPEERRSRRVPRPVAARQTDFVYF